MVQGPQGTSKLLAHIYDYYHDELTFLITGSAVGVMKSILDPGARSPMFGRVSVEKEVRRWEGKLTGFNFLREGCIQNGFAYREDELSEAVDRLPGWLTAYGDHRKALRETVDEGMKIVGEELRNTSSLALGWERQMMTLKKISEGA